MKQAVRGMIFSGLVYPGLGQMLLGSRLLGAAIISLTTAGMGGIVYCVMQRLPFLMEQLQQELQTGMPDMGRIIEISTRSAAIGNSPLEQASLYLLLFCWAGSTIHAYFLGRKQPTSTRSGNRNNMPVS